MRRLSLVALATAVAAAACAPGDAPREPEGGGDPAASPEAALPGLELGPVELRGPVGSGEPHLSGGTGGPALLTWLEPAAADRSGTPEEAPHALRIAERRAGAWSEPRTVASGRRFFVNWADFPSVTRLSRDTLLVHWLEKVDGGPYAYHVLASLSRDGGRSWGEPIKIHRDDSPTEHGFVSVEPWEGGAALVWLDGRAMAAGSGHGPGADVAEAEAGPEIAAGADAGATEGGTHPPDAASGAMGLRATTLSSRGALGAEVLLDDRTCECCATALARTSSGLVAAYRDRGPEEVRDVYAVRFDGKRWTEPRPVHRDGWVIGGCPVNGPQLSAAGDTVAIAWFTAPDGRPRVHVAFSTDAGTTWESPVRVDAGMPLGRVDVELLADGSAAVAWIEAEARDARPPAAPSGTEASGADEPGGEAGLLLRRVAPSGSLGPPIRVAGSDGSRAAGFPRLARSGGDLLVSWTVPGPEGGIRVRVVRAADAAGSPELGPS